MLGFYDFKEILSTVNKHIITNGLMSQKQKYLNLKEIYQNTLNKIAITTKKFKCYIEEITQQITNIKNINSNKNYMPFPKTPIKSERVRKPIKKYQKNKQKKANKSQNPFQKNMWLKFHLTNPDIAIQISNPLYYKKHITTTHPSLMQKKQVNQLVINRLKKQRKDWRTDHPFGFVAKPMENKDDGTTNMLKWLCEIPGPANTPWEEGTYTLTIDFTHDFPVRQKGSYLRPPKCMFKPVLPHPNIYPSGTVCLSILNDEEDWKPHITVRQILIGIQKLLRDEPNIQSPAQQQPLTLYKANREQYIKKVRTFALSCKKNNN